MEEKFIYPMYFVDEKVLETKLKKEEKKLKEVLFVKKTELQSEIKKRKSTEEEKRFWVRLTKKCNNRCIFCLDSEVQDGSVIPFSEIQNQLIEGRKEKFDRLILSGGEPTLHPQFLEIVKEGKKLGYKKIQVISNGRMFMYKDFLMEGVRNGISEITFSIHGHTPEIHDRLTQIEGSFFQSILGLRNALKVSNLIVSVDIVINKLNYKYLPEILNFFISLGVREFDLLQVVPFGRAWENRKKVFYDIKKALPYLKKTFEISKEKGVFIWTNRFPAQYLEGFEYLIQSPKKIFDEVNGRKELFWKFLKEGKMMDCFGERCRFCFLESFCQDLIKIKKEKKLYGKRFPFCLERFRTTQTPSCLKLEITEKFLENFTNFYIEERYFVKKEKCKKCTLEKKCEGAPVIFIRENGFSILQPK